MLTVILTLAALGACSDEGGPEGALLGSAVSGHLLLQPGRPAQLCEELSGSPPDGCAGRATTVVGLGEGDVTGLESAGETRWSAAAVTLYGDLAGDELTVPVQVRGPAINGRALAGPTCPVETFPPDPNCAPMVVAGAAVAVVDETGDAVVEVVTDATGRFAVSLPAGTYTVEPGPVEGLMGQAPPVTVTVGESPVDVDLAYDTGIR